MSDLEMCCGGTCVRAVCEYHGQHEQKKPSTERKYAFMWKPDIRTWTQLASWESPWEGKFLTADGYIHTYQGGKLVDEEPA